MTEEQLHAIQQRAEQATDGPWEAWVPDSELEDPAINAQDGNWIAGTAYDGQSLSRAHNVEADTIFIAHARQDIPDLLKEVRRLQTLLANQWHDATDPATPVPFNTEVLVTAGVLYSMGTRYEDTPERFWLERIGGDLTIGRWRRMEGIRYWANLPPLPKVGS